MKPSFTHRNTSLFYVGLAALLFLISIPTQAQDVSLDLAFVTHLDIDLPEQDVFIEREAGSGKVYRVTKGDHNMNAQLYAAADYVPHDPFNPEAVGPYKKGAPLGMTLSQWAEAVWTGNLYL